MALHVADGRGGASLQGRRAGGEARTRRRSGCDDGGGFGRLASVGLVGVWLPCLVVLWVRDQVHGESHAERKV